MSICLASENLWNRIIKSLPDQTSSAHLKFSNFDGDWLTKYAAWLIDSAQKRFEQTRMKSYASFPLHESLVHPLYGAILSWGLLDSEVPSNVFLLAKLYEPFISIFTSIVIAQVLDLPPSLILYFDLPFFELHKDFRFLSHEVDLKLSWIIIYEYDIIASTIIRFYRWRPSRIRANVIENTLRSVFLFYNLERNLDLLSKYTILAKVQLARLHVLQ